MGNCHTPFRGVDVKEILYGGYKNGDSLSVTVTENFAGADGGAAKKSGCHSKIFFVSRG